MTNLEFDDMRDHILLRHDVRVVVRAAIEDAVSVFKRHCRTCAGYARQLGVELQTNEGDDTK